MTTSSEAAVAAIAADVVDRLRTMLPERAGLHEPLFEGNERAYVSECVETGWVSSVGEFVDRFESTLAEYTGAKRAVALVNGTAALHLALRLVGVGRDDEVLIPSLTFVATANAVVHAGAIPHFIDVTEKTLGMDPVRLEERLEEVAERRDDGSTWNRETGRRIMACVPMHTFGHPVEMDRICAVCDRWGIRVVEDAAESLGSCRDDQHTGTFGILGALSFNGNKTITTGGGGALLTMDEELGARAKHLSTTAKVPHPYEYVHDDIGYNYRMPNLNAALGCAQLERLPDMLRRKRRLADRYATVFADATYGKIFLEPDGARSNYWLNALVLERGARRALSAVLQETNEARVMTRPAWRPLHLLKIYANAPAGDLEMTADLAGRVVSLPSSAFLEDA